MRLEYRARVCLVDARIPQVIPSHRLARHARTLQQAAFLSASASHLHGTAHLQHEQASIAESLIAHRRAAVGDLNAGTARIAVAQPAAPPPLRSLTVAIPTPRLEEAEEEMENAQQQPQPQRVSVSSSTSSPPAPSLSLPAMEDGGVSRASSPSPSEVLLDASDVAEAVSEQQLRASSPFTLRQLSTAAAPAASFDSEMAEGDGDGDVDAASSSPSSTSSPRAAGSSNSRASSKKRSARLHRLYRRMRHSREEEEGEQSDDQSRCSSKPPPSSSSPPAALYPTASSSPLAVYQMDASKFSASSSPAPSSVLYPVACLPHPVLLSSPTAVFPQQQPQQLMMQQPPLSFPQLLYLQAQQQLPQPVYFPFFPLQPAVFLQPQQQQMPRYLPPLFFSAAPIISSLPSAPMQQQQQHTSAFLPAAARSAQCPYLISTLPSHVSNAALRASA